jgi:hypothetical protein
MEYSLMNKNCKGYLIRTLKYNITTKNAKITCDMHFSLSYKVAVSIHQ